MESLAAIVVTGASAFAATNVDDLVLLTAFFAAGSFCTRDIVLGQYLGIAALFWASAAASAVSVVIPPGYLALLGLLPIALGIRELLRARRGGDVPEVTLPHKHDILGVAAVTIASGGDNLAVYTTLFANSAAWAVAGYGAVFAAATALWCLAARWLVDHPAAGAPIRRYGRQLAPIILIAIGFVVLLS